MPPSDLSFLIENLAEDMAMDFLSADALRMEDSLLHRPLADPRTPEPLSSAPFPTPESLRLSLLRARDEERRRIARDLHDVTAQLLLTLEFDLQSIRSGQEDLRDRAHKSACSTVEILQKQVRCFSYLLHPPELERLGLLDALDTLVSGLAFRTGLDIAFDAQGYRPGACPESELSIFRVAQAALMNVFKHSGALQTEVLLTSRCNWLVLRVRDHGCGVPQASPPDSPWRTGGVGMNGMNARMEGLCGRFTVRRHDTGTLVTAIAPRFFRPGRAAPGNAPAPPERIRAR